MIAVLLLNLAAATQDIATDGLAVDMLEASERGLGNGVQVAGYRVGMIVGGGALLGLHDRLGPSGVFVAMSLLTALATLPIGLARETRRRLAAHASRGRRFTSSAGRARPGCWCSSWSTRRETLLRRGCSGRSSSTRASVWGRSAGCSERWGSPPACSGRWLVASWSIAWVASRRWSRSACCRRPQSRAMHAWPSENRVGRALRVVRRGAPRRWHGYRRAVHLHDGLVLARRERNRLHRAGQRGGHCDVPGVGGRRVQRAGARVLRALLPRDRDGAGGAGRGPPVLSSGGRDCGESGTDEGGCTVRMRSTPARSIRSPPAMSRSFSAARGCSIASWSSSP